MGLIMADSKPSPISTNGIPSSVLAPLILGPLDYALAAGARRALECGAPTERLIELLLNHLASVVAMVEPAGAREGIIRSLVGSFAPMVKQHVDARLTSAGGIVHPKAGV